MTLKAIVVETWRVPDPFPNSSNVFGSANGSDRARTTSSLYEVAPTRE